MILWKWSGRPTACRQRMGTRVWQKSRCRLVEHLEDRCPLAADAATAMLPDLVVVVNEASGYQYGWTIDDSREKQVLMRISTGVANIGEGPMELRGRNVTADGKQEVWQRITQHDGSSTERLAGTFVYHPTHGHTHFEGFAEYNLRSVLPDGQAGEIIATGGKTSFCLLDFEPYDRTIIGAPEAAHYGSCSASQGISPGWADIYHEGLDDQWIDVTGVPHGRYWLEVIADPENRLLESNESNNVERILIDYRTTERVTADAAEPNDDSDHAFVVPSLPVIELDNLNIHASGNDDWYIWTAPQSGIVTVELQFDAADGDLNFAFGRGAGEVAHANSTSAPERFQQRVVKGVEYYVLVNATVASKPLPYRLSLKLEANLPDVPDVWEPNESRGTSHNLGGDDIAATDLTIGNTVDEDYFRWTANFDGYARLATSTGDAPPVDLFVYDRLGRLLAAAASAAADQELVVPVTARQLVFIRVAPHETGHVTSYSLQLDGPQYPLGDANGDGRFDSTDLVQVFQAGKYESDRLAAWDEGDWNRDGRFDTGDLVAAFQAATYQEIAAARRQDLLLH